MNIQNPTTSLPKAPGAGLLVSAAKVAAAGTAPSPITVKVSGAESDLKRPTRLNRAPEEAALFAYNSQAQITAAKGDAQIDEYV